MDTCMNSCTAIPVGGSADTSGNTLGCRIYHAHAAMSMNNPGLHCPHAGPGGDGVCGSICDGYCQIAMKFCVGANKVYNDLNDCQTTCASFPNTKRFNVTDPMLQDTKEQACLLYHVQEGSANPPDHCLGDLAKTATLASITCH
jgi:hypothetical protein